MPDNDVRSSPIEQTHVARGRWVAIAVATLAVVGALALPAIVLLGTEIDLDDLFDSLEPARVPAGLLVFMIVLVSFFLRGQVWARWVLAAGLAAGSAWMLLAAEVARSWAGVVIGIAIAWGCAAIVLITCRWVAAFVRERGHHAAASYERLLGPLVRAEDAVRWLAVIDQWHDAGVLTWVDRRRISKALEQWLVWAPTVDPELEARIRALAPPARDPGAVRRLLGRMRRAVHALVSRSSSIEEE